MEEIRDKNRLFSNKDLLILFVPLIIEQFLEYLVGLADSMMVSWVGQSAVSGVSLVDFMMALLISLFVALATGGSVVIGQYLGKKDKKMANVTANQLVWFSATISLVIMGIVYILKSSIFSVLFGSISSEVYYHANVYFMVVVASIPFLAVYNSGASIFRSIGNSKFPMKVMLLMNILNVIGNAIFIFYFNLGTMGIAISTLISRIGAAFIVTFALINKNNILYLIKSLKFKFNKKIIMQILNIGAPFAFENGMFYLGRLIVLSLVAVFGTSAIAANSVGGTMVTFEVLPGTSIGLGLSVVISRCIGMGDYKQAKYYTKKIIKIIYISFVVSCIIVFSLLPAILSIYNLSSEATLLTKEIVFSHGIIMTLIWPLGYTLPVVFRASGNSKFPMFVSTLTMIICRILFAYVFSLCLGMGMFGTWVAMYFDWIIKAFIFTFSYIRERWVGYSVI